MTDNITLPRAVTDRDAMKLALRALDTLSAYTLVSHEGSIYAQARKTLRAALAEPSLKVSVDPTAFTASAFSQAAVLEQAEAFETAYQTKRAALDDALAEPKQKSAFQVDAERYRWLRGEVQGSHTPLAQVVWKRNNIRESGDWTNLSDGQALDEAIDAALAEPPAKPKPATMQQIIESHLHDDHKFLLSRWDYFHKAWREAERFHGIGGDGK